MYIIVISKVAIILWRYTDIHHFVASSISSWRDSSSMISEASLSFSNYTVALELSLNIILTYCPKIHQIFTELFILSTLAKSLLTNTVSWRPLWESFLTKSFSNTNEKNPTTSRLSCSVVLFTVLDKKYIKPPTNSSKFVSSDQIRFIQ